MPLIGPFSFIQFYEIGQEKIYIFLICGLKNKNTGYPNTVEISVQCLSIFQYCTVVVIFSLSMNNRRATCNPHATYCRKSYSRSLQHSVFHKERKTIFPLCPTLRRQLCNRKKNMLKSYRQLT